MKNKLLLIGSFTILTMAIFSAACGTASPEVSAGKMIASGPAGNNLTATIANTDGTLRKGKQDFTLTFADASGKPVNVGSVALNSRMAAMGSMAEMNNGATFTTTGTPGVYKGSIDIEMAGEWQAQITYEGAAGKGSFSLPIVAK